MQAGWGDLSASEMTMVSVSMRRAAKKLRANTTPRQLWLELEEYRVVRFWNSDITGDLMTVLERIYVELYGSREAEVKTLKHLRRG